MSFVEIASVSELSAGRMKPAKVNGKSVLLANLSGSYFAIGNICTHMGCSLTNGTLNGEVVECQCHGSRFNVKTGKVVGGPAAVDEPSFSVKVVNGKILVSIPEE